MAEMSEDRLQALVVWLIVTLCGVVAAGLIAAVAALTTVVLSGDAMEIFTVAGTTFGACLTLEIALVGLYLTGRHRTS
ncbi:hypothetical protein [Verrucosispora sp. TAA-831]|uniref:hypothetical protein n=1 Tax=Verrucosispora sp. TAA-831 TaxID=3422227 RepID=UPI003D6DCC21